MVEKKNIYLYKEYCIQGIFEIRATLLIGILVYLYKQKKICCNNAE